MGDRLRYWFRGSFAMLLLLAVSPAGCGPQPPKNPEVEEAGMRAGEGASRIGSGTASQGTGVFSGTSTAPLPPMPPPPVPQSPNAATPQCRRNRDCGTHVCKVSAGRCAYPCTSTEDCTGGYECRGAGTPTAICVPITY